MDAIEASEEWNAAMESEIMKGPKRQGTRGRFTKLPSSLPRVRCLRLSTSRRPIETRGRDIFQWTWTHESLKMRLIEPDEHKEFLATLERIGLARDDFSLQETDTTDPKGDENFGLQGYVIVTRLSTRVAKEYTIGDESDWLEHFRKDLEAGAFDRLE
jgi:hypothetical protein